MTTPLDRYAAQYVQFEDERTRPIRDLLAAVPNTPIHTAIDIGCGPGNSTEALIARAPDATVHGIDASADMIDAARTRPPGLRFDVVDISTWDDPGGYDLILANAVLQWVPAHDTLFPALVGRLAPGGHLAVQMPDNLDEPAHRLMREVAAAGTWADKLKGAARTERFDARDYHALLSPLCSRVDVWRTTYYHPLRGGCRRGRGVVQGQRAAAVPRGARRRRARGVSRAVSRCARRPGGYPALADGTVLLPFRAVHRRDADVTRH